MSVTNDKLIKEPIFTLMRMPGSHGAWFREGGPALRFAPGPVVALGGHIVSVDDIKVHHEYTST